MSKFKVGDRVRLLPYTKASSLDRHTHENHIRGGNRGVVQGYDPDDAKLPFDVRFNEMGGSDGHDWCTLEMLESIEPAKMTPEQRAIAKAEASLRALKDRAAKKAKDAAERKTKAERAKVVRGLSPAGKRVVELLRSKPGAFGCQREHAISLACAIICDDAEKIRKALAH